MEVIAEGNEEEAHDETSSRSPSEDGRQVIESPKWTSSTYYLFALLCWVLGVANFASVIPILIRDSALIIPTLIVVVFFSTPATFMEMAISQYSSKTGIQLWDVLPMFKCVGLLNVLAMALLLDIEICVSAYILYYGLTGFNIKRSWSNCNQSWAQVNCYIHEENISRRHYCIEKYNESYCNSLVWETSAEQFWKYYVLNLSETTMGLPKLEMVCYVIITMLIVFVCIYNDKKSIEKLLPCLLLIPSIGQYVLYFLSLIGYGGYAGHQYILSPNIETISNIDAWIEVFENIFISVGLGLGGYTTLASESDFRDTIYLKAISVNLADLLCSVVCGLMVLNFFGTDDYHTSSGIKTIALSNESLLFSRIPRAMSSLPGVEKMWIATFYLSLYLVSIRNLVMTEYMLLQIFFSFFPKQRKRYTVYAALLSLIIFPLTLVIVTREGIYFLKTTQIVVSHVILPLVNTMQIMGIMWFYGITHFLDDVHFMLGQKVPTIWRLCYLITPFITGSICIYNLLNIFHTGQPEKIQAIYIYRTVLLIVGPTIAIVGVSAYVLKMWLKSRSIFAPSDSWGPTDTIAKKSRRIFSAHSMTKEYMYRQNRLKDTTRTDGTYIIDF